MIFQFKQFQVDQSGCAMKINTDGVLLGATAGSGPLDNILDIGTGTGVIAMMMAQRFPGAKIDAVEVDSYAANTAGTNFAASAFADRLNSYPMSFEQYFSTYPEREYDLIVSNPPFYINSLEAATDKKNLAKHADEHFFDTLMSKIPKHLTTNGQCWLILPPRTAQLVKTIATKNGLFVQHVTAIRSFESSEPHREIIAFGLSQTKPHIDGFTIYDAPKVYGRRYRDLLRDFFTIF